MPTFMLQVAYSSAALNSLITHPEDRAEAIRRPIENLGGRIAGFWLSFGELYDYVCVIEMPDNVTAAAFGLAMAAGGSIKAQKITTLLTMEDGLTALKKAGASGYVPIAA
jgi:uncharacterized protein with GYD domain